MNILRPIQKEFYGDDFRWFMGAVVNANPPAGLEGRVKVRIHGVHNPSTGEIPEADLPWAQVLTPSTEGGSSGIGKIPQIITGSFVFGIFLDGVSSQLPIVLGTLSRIEYPSQVQKVRRATNTNAVDYTQQRLLNTVIEPIRNDGEQSASVSLRRQQCLKFFIDNGYSLIRAAAITGAIEARSNFILYTSNLEEPQGIAKWETVSTTNSRYSQLVRFGSRNSPTANWKLFSVQLQFVLFELRNQFSNANRKLLSSNDLKEASVAVNKFYLNSYENTEVLAQIAYDGALV